MPSLIQQQIKQRRRFRTLEEEVFVGLQLVSDRLMEPWERELRESAELTHVQYNVLRILRGAGEDGLRASEIGERLITRSPDVTRIVDRLAQRRLVHRAPDPEDRRAVRVRITAAGRERLAPLDERSTRAIGEVLGSLDRRRLEALRDTLDELLAALQRHGA